MYEHIGDRTEKDVWWDDEWVYSGSKEGSKVSGEPFIGDKDKTKK